MATTKTADRKLPEDEWADILPEGGAVDGDAPLYDADLDMEIDLGRSIPEGATLFVVKEITDTSDGPSGYPNIRMRVEALSGDGAGKTMIHQVSLSPKADWRLNQFLDALGLPSKGKTSPGKWINLRFWGNVIHESWNERLRPKIDDYLLGQSTELEDERAAAEAEAYREGPKRRRNGAAKKTATLGSEFE